ncbi:MAG: signal peptidase I [Candidatus Paceibacterota bacterium]
MSLEHPQTPPQPRSIASSFFIDVIRFAFIALIIVVPFRIFIAQPFIVNGQSMAPTFDTGEYLIVDQLSYQLNNPHRGDVIVFRSPEDRSTFFIKRIVGLPGETVEINRGDVIIHNAEHPNGILLDEPYVEHTKIDSLRTSLKNDEYFVLGDNRQASSDSRSWGPLERELIQGRPLIRLFPLQELNLLPGSYKQDQ